MIITLIIRLGERRAVMGEMIGGIVTCVDGAEWSGLKYALFAGRVA